jgi:hypothetical protein
MFGIRVFLFEDKRCLKTLLNDPSTSVLSEKRRDRQKEAEDGPTLSKM